MGWKQRTQTHVHNKGTERERKVPVPVYRYTLSKAQIKGLKPPINGEQECERRIRQRTGVIV